MSFHVRRLKDEAPPSSLSKAVKWLRRLRLPALFVFWRAKEVKEKHDEEKKRSRLWKRLLVSAAVIVIAVAGIGVGVKALVDQNIIQVTQLVNVAGTPLPKDEHGYTNFLLLGQGDKNHDGVDLTDTIILASIDPKTRSAAMISIPRDLYLRTSRMGAGRINTLYRDFKYTLMRDQDLDEEQAGRAAMQELATELSKTFGIQLHHVVKVDFIGFVQAVDALGGVDVVVPEDLYDSEYPGPNYTYQTFSVLAGPQHMDGETALKYARSRHSTSDFDRSRRQQDILKALGDKAKADGTLTNPARITSLMRIMNEHVATTLTFREMVTLAGMAADLDKSKIISVQFNVAGPGGFLYPPPRDQYGGAAVLVPNSWNEVRTFMGLVLADRTLFLHPPTIDVYNAGGPSGAAGMLAVELDRYMLPVGDVANYAGDDRPTSAIIAPAADRKTAQKLGELLRIPDVATLPETSTGTTIQVLLGEDYRYRSIVELTASDASSSSSAPASAPTTAGSAADPRP
jgi:LCP family protein required for cell wall assembly